jgi:hypothetical protein
MQAVLAEPGGYRSILPDCLCADTLLPKVRN